MPKTNGKSDVDTERLDLEHELPPSEEAMDEELQDREAPSGAPPAVESELQKVKAERDALLDRLARLQAEFENARKRVAREQQDFREYAVSDAVKALLPVLDSFDRALQQASAGRTEFRAGIELINKQFHDALAKLGLRPIPAKGEPFDPHLHQAIEMVDSEEVQDHLVLDELQKGYKFKDRLLRPSMVRVARNTKS
jgi:molecular chaperone GrpE